MGLQPRDAIDDVDARLLQRPRPADVGALVEARLELHQADRLLAALRGLDQGRHQRRVRARPVDGLLDREHVRVLDGLADEALDRARRRSHRDGGRGCRPGGSRRRRRPRGGCGCPAGARRRHALPGRIAQLAEPVNGVDVGEVVQAEQPGGLVDLLGIDVHRLDELVAQAAAPCPGRPRAARPRRSGGGGPPPRPRAAGRRPRRRRRSRCPGSRGRATGGRSPFPGRGRRGWRRSHPRAARRSAHRRRSGGSAGAAPSAP